MESVASDSQSLIYLVKARRVTTTTTSHECVWACVWALRGGEIVYPVMCADALTRGVPCKPADEWLLLPQVPNPALPCYYTHVGEITNKVTQELKSAGCWQADPREGQPSLAASAPGQEVEVSNRNQLKSAWNRWTPMDAPLPIGTAPLWRELLKTHEFTFTDDKAILWNPVSWVWEDNPTWCISGVSSEKTAAVGHNSNHKAPFAMLGANGNTGKAISDACKTQQVIEKKRTA